MTTSGQADLKTKQSAIVESAIAAAAAKVRINDLLTGFAMIAVVALTYVVVMMALDKLLELPGVVRQLGFVGLLVGIGLVGYIAVYRPIRRQVNPRYIARQVEATIPDAKNVLINWVDLQEKELPGTVKAAVSARAASSMDNADLDEATHSKRLIGLGLTIAVLVAVLSVFFLLFKFTQFTSLFQRAVNPFVSANLATQTQIELVEPAGGDVAIFDGDPLTLVVHLAGRIPDSTSAEKPRLLVRYSQDDDQFVELPLNPTETDRNYALDVPRSTILSGFWYKVSAGDATTPEYRVQVRTRPALIDFKAEYTYPAYFKWPNSEASTPNLRAWRGSTVSYAVKANRELQAGVMTVRAGGQLVVIRGKVIGEPRETLLFSYKIQDDGVYTIGFKPSGAEHEVISPEYPIQVDLDQSPKVELLNDNKPTASSDPGTLPTNGLVTVDAKLSDDFGLASATLRVATIGKETVELAAKPYRNGKAFQRGDGTATTNLDYKDSISLTELTTKDGKPVQLSAGQELEYWLEATDHCTEPEANVGISKRIRVKLSEPKEDDGKAQDQQQAREQRKQEEKAAQQKQDDKLKNDKRPDEQNRDPNKQDANTEKKPEAQTKPDGNNQEQKQPETNGQTQPEDQKNKDQPPQKNQEKSGGEKGTEAKADKNNEPKQNESSQAETGSTADQTKKEADDLQKKLDEKNQQQSKEPSEGKDDGRNSAGEQSKPSAEAKPDNTKSGKEPQQPAEVKAGQDEQKDSAQPSESKNAGQIKDPQPSEAKPGAKDNAKPEQQASDRQQKAPPKSEEQAGKAKDSKPMSGEIKSQGKDEASDTKPGASEKKEKEDGQPSQQKEQDQARNGASKPSGKPERDGTKKPSSSEQEKNAAEGKAEKPMEPGSKKGEEAEQKKDGRPMKPEDGAYKDAAAEKGSPNAQDKKDQPAESKPEGQKPAKTEDAKGKPDKEQKSQQDKTAGQNGTSPSKPEDGGTDAQKQREQKDIEQAAKDLQSADPKVKEAAKKKLDEKIGKQNREAIEQLQKDSMSEDSRTREDAEKKVEELAKAAGPKPQENKPTEMSEAQKKELTEAAEKLNSKDEAERSNAEKKLDEAIGSDKRKELQNDLKDLQGTDPDKKQKAQEKLEKLAKDAIRNPGKESEQDKSKLGGGNLDKDGKPIALNPENQLKTREQQLRSFKELRGNKDFLKEAGYTPEQFEDFLKRQEGTVDKLREDVANRKQPASPAGASTVGQNDFSQERIKGGKEGGGVSGAGGPSVAPPGFAEAQKRFAAEAAKREADRNKQK